MPTFRIRPFPLQSLERKPCDRRTLLRSVRIKISQALQVSTDYLLTGNRNTSDYITLDSKLATVDSAKYDRIMRVVDIMLEET